MDALGIKRYVRSVQLKRRYFLFAMLPLLLAVFVSGASAQLINLNFTAGTDYVGSSETSPATPGGPAGTWNSITLAAANTDVAVTYADGGAGPTLVMDTGRDGDWASTSITTLAANYTGSGAVYDVANLYEAGIINSGNFTTGYRLKGLAPGTYAVHVVPMYRGYDPASATYLAGVHLIIGTGNDTDARDAGDFTLVTTDATPEQNIDTSLTSWVAATDGSTPYNYVTAIVTIDSTDRWLTFLLEDGGDPDRPGPAVIQIEPSGGQPSTVPVFTEILLDGQDVILRGSNGPASSAYQVLATTNLALPLYSWGILETNMFDISGAFDTTNAVAPELDHQFFRLLLGTDPVPGPTAPSITSQPQSLTVAVGATTNFFISADGSAPLHYFWSFNTNTSVGGDSDALTLSNIQTSDAGIYRVVVSNSVGTATSTDAELTVLIPPSITDNPTNLTVAAGGSAVFTAGATGSDPLAYQWYLNASTQIAGATNATLTLNSVDAADAGNYHAVVSNAVGSAASSEAQLTVLGPPVITGQPEDVTVAVSNSAEFTVTATGPAPLTYQWFFNSSTPVGSNSNVFALASAQTNDAGAYSVVVSNSYGAVTSSVANLDVVTVPAIGTPDSYATHGSGTTGGAGGTTVTVDNLTDFEFYAGHDDPYIVQVSGTINFDADGSGDPVRVTNNKTIVGLGTNAMVLGNLKVFRNNNIIIQNITFTNPGGDGDGDGLTLNETENVWVDHCTFYDAADGNLDISHGSDWITVSWCKFFYTSNTADHRFSNLIGHTDSSTGEAEDMGKLHVTYHHCWWSDNVHERMPRVRFGRVHLYNNYYNSPGNNYCLRAARDSENLVENNYYLNVKNVWELYRTVGEDGKVFATNNVEVATTWSTGDSKVVQIPGTDVLSSDANGLNPPPYAYTLDPAANVPGMVTSDAGAGKGPFAY